MPHPAPGPAVGDRSQRSFRVTSYITDELIDWSAAPDDPIYRLYSP